MCQCQYLLFGVSVSLMADTVFKADFRGSCTFEATGLKVDDSSVEICMETILTEEDTQKHTHMRAHAHKQDNR